MITIWKFRFKLADEITLLMPEGTHVLTVQLQHGVPHIWALCDSEKPKRDHVFFLLGTGDDAGRLKQGSSYVGTFQVGGGDFVFHLWTKVEGVK